MKRRVLLFGLAVVLAANLAAGYKACRNRSGAIEAEVWLTERELQLDVERESSLLALQIGPWGTFSRVDQSPQEEEAVLRRFGFDLAPITTKRDSSEGDADHPFHRRRPGFAAIEVDGPAWEAFRDAASARIMEKTDQSPENKDAERQLLVLTHSRGLLVDVDRDPVALRTRHPDRSKVLILPAVVRAEPHWGPKAQTGWWSWQGHLINHTLSVPSTLGKLFPPYVDRGPTNLPPRFRVKIDVGSHFEPYISAVEPLPGVTSPARPRIEIHPKD